MKLNYFSIIFFIISYPLVAGIQIHYIRPDSTDTRIKTFISEPHYVLTADLSNQRNLLLVHLGASFQKTDESSYYLQLAANAGYHVII